MTKEHENRMKMIRKFEKNIKSYPYLNKVIKWQSFPKLKAFLRLADNRVIDTKTLKHKNKYPYFTLTLHELTKKFGGTPSTWNRNINLFVSLGLIGKVNPFELNKKNGLLAQHNLQGKVALAKKLRIPISEVQEQNMYYIFPYTKEILQRAEQRAKTMYENGFSLRSFSKIFLQRVFGLEFANTVFFNDIQESKFTMALYQQIEDVALKMLEQKHFTFKQEIIANIKIDITVYKHYEIIYPKVKFKDSKQAVVEFEYGRSIKMICNNRDIECCMSNKELNGIFGLKSNKQILYDKDYVENWRKLNNKK